MNFAYTFKNFEASDHLKKYAARRLEKLGRFINKADNVEVQVIMTVDKHRHIVDVKFTGDNMNIAAREDGHDMYASVDVVRDKLEAQLKKLSEKSKDFKTGHGKSLPAIDYFDYEAVGKGKSAKIVGRDHFVPKPMEPVEAAMQLEQGEDEFLVFLNSETEAVNVIYKRNNGNFGLIAPGFE